MKNNKLLNLLIGDPDHFTIEKRCLSACALVSTIISSIIFLTTVSLSLSIQTVILTFTSTLTFLIIYTLSKREPRLWGLEWLFLFCIIIIIVIDWFYLGGYTGLLLPVTVALAGVLPIIMKPKDVTPGFMLLLLSMTIVYGASLLYPEFIPRHEPSFLHLTDRFIDVAVVAVGFGMLVQTVMKTFRYQRDRLNSLNRDLKNKNTELQKAFSEIESLATELRCSLEEQQEISNRLKTNTDLLDTLFEAIPIPVFYKDQNKVFKRVNSAFCEVFNESKEEILGYTAAEIKPDIGVETSVQTDEQVLVSKQPVSYETKLRYNDGLHHQVIMNKNCHVDMDGTPLGIIGSITDITERKIREEQVQYLAHHDILTGLHNRAFFNSQLGKKLAKAIRKNEKLAILFIDLDGFKIINDTLGHAAGDATLKTIGARLLSHTREYDTICRLGGDEFGAIIDDLSENDDINAIAQKILTALVVSIPYKSHECRISGSIGIAFYPDNGKSKDDLVRAADEAMYRAKSLGKNQYVISNIIVGQSETR